MCGRSGGDGELAMAELEEKVRVMNEGRQSEKTEIGVERGEIYAEEISNWKRKFEFEAEFRFFCVKINGSLRLLFRGLGETKETAWRWQRSKKSEASVSRVYSFGFLD